MPTVPNRITIWHRVPRGLKVWQAGCNPPNHPQLSVNDTAYQQQSVVTADIYNQIGVGGQMSGSVDNVRVKRVNANDDDDEDDGDEN